VKPLSRTLAPLALALVLAAPAIAQEYVKMKDGTLVKGDATAYDEATETLTFRMENGSERGFKLSELDLRSVYLVNRSRVPKDDFDRQLRIGKLACEVGLYAHAMRHFDQALKADPARGAEADAAVAELKRAAATYGMQMAKDAVSKGDLREAETWLVKLTEKLPDEPEGVQAQQMLDQYYARNRREREAKVLAQASAAQQKSLEVAKGHYDKMIEKTQKGLTTKSSGNASVASWQSALKDGGRALKALAAIDTGGGDAVSSDQLDGYRRMVVDQMVEIHLHLASLWTVRSSYNQALSETNQALALDPTSESALAARARIERAASERRWIW
jgi:tetratricopeptide (TPR) repeat protein